MILPLSLNVKSGTNPSQDRLHREHGGVLASATPLLSSLPKYFKLNWLIAGCWAGYVAAAWPRLLVVTHDSCCPRRPVPVTSSPPPLPQSIVLLISKYTFKYNRSTEWQWAAGTWHVALPCFHVPICQVPPACSHVSHVSHV